GATIPLGLQKPAGLSGRGTALLQLQNPKRIGTGKSPEPAGWKACATYAPLGAVGEVHLASSGFASTTTPGRTRSTPSTMTCSPAFTPVLTTRSPSMIGP